MNCKVEGCDRVAMYTGLKLCQKHYFRHMRTGIYHLVPRRKPFQTNPAGYISIHKPSSPLSNKSGMVYLHRQLIYEKYGENLPNCGICGKETFWATCHIDHIDENVANNDINNIRPVCRGCNTARTPRKTIMRYEYNGKMMSVTELSTVEGVQVGRPCLRRRIESGMSIVEAMFSKNLTHPKTESASSKK
jgi:hypothetical protein